LIFKTSGFFFFYFLVIGIVVVFLAKMLAMRGYDSIQIGILLSIPAFMRFLTPFLFLKLFKLNKQSFTTALIVMIASAVAMFWSMNNYYLLMLNMLFFGVTNALILPFVDSIALSHLKKEKYGRSRLWGSIGFMLVTLILARYLNSAEIGFYIFIAAIIFTSVFGLLLRDGVTEQRQKEGRADGFSIIKFWPLWVSMFLLQCSFGVFYGFFTLYENLFGVTLESISYLWAVAIVFEVLMFRFQAKILKLNLLTLIKFATFVTVIRWTLLYLFPGNLSLLYFAQTLHAITFALYHSATIAHLMELYSNQRLAQQFYYGLTYGLGGFIGANIGGFIFGPNLFLVTSVIALFSFAFLFLHKIKSDSVSDK
jgi:PPP family 3-phenylpropionic acid transporter